MTAVEERLTRPLRSGRTTAIAGLVAVVAAQAFGHGSGPSFLLMFAGVVAATWGVVQVTAALARLYGRRSLTEAAVGLGLFGTADAMAVTAAMGPQDRENTWFLIIAGIGFALLGLALGGSATADFRGERHRIDDPPPPPPPGATTRPQPPGVHLHPVASGFLKATLAISVVTFVAALTLALVRG